MLLEWINKIKINKNINKKPWEKYFSKTALFFVSYSTYLSEYKDVFPKKETDEAQ